MTYVLKKNYEPARAHDGQEAVKMALTGEYALVIMDLKMPVMDGLEATRQIKMAMPDRPTPSTATVRQHSKPVATTSCRNLSVPTSA